MADAPQFPLDAEFRWRLAYDNNQWVLQKRVGSSGRNRYGIRESGWRGISFVGGKKTTLERIVHEKGIVLTAEAHANFDVLPERFLDFTKAVAPGPANVVESASAVPRRLALRQGKDKPVSSLCQAETVVTRE